MKPLISVVINSYNEGKQLDRCLESVKGLADEIVVVDMGSSDDSQAVAVRHGAKVFPHKWMIYVEPARNFAIEKAKGKWILLLDPDEKIGRSLAKKLREIARSNAGVDYVLLPRKNIIFGKWIQNSRWWPDYLPRFFKKGSVAWPTQIHQQPELKGNILTLPDAEKLAIVHYNYESLDGFLDRAKRYAEVQSDELVREKKYRLAAADLVLKPLGEFLSRFFVGEGFRDGLHGLALAVLQSYTVALTYLKVWEKQRFEERTIENGKIREIFKKVIYEIDYWQGRWWAERFKGYKRKGLSLLAKGKSSFLKIF